MGQLRNVAPLAVVDPARDIKPNGRPGYLPIEIRIDGRDLIEIVHDIELPLAMRDWDRVISGSLARTMTPPSTKVRGALFAACYE